MGEVLRTQYYCSLHRTWTDDFHERCAVFVAPTEPERLKAIGLSSLLPEEYGVDILWESELGRVGIQRKVFPGDFLASVHDGRLNKEYAQMRSLDLAYLLLEGKEFWTEEGALIRDPSGVRRAWSRDQHRNYLASVQLRGVMVLSSDDLSDTLRMVAALRVWSNKPDHHSLDTRPNPSGDQWGKVTNLDYQSHILQGLPGIGPKQSQGIIATLGFPLCLREGVDREALMTVPGIGKGRADKILRVFGRNPNGA